MDPFRDLTSEEMNYIFNLISIRCFVLQKNSFLFSGERIFLEKLLSKFGFVLEFEGGYYIPKYNKKTFNFDK